MYSLFMRCSEGGTYACTGYLDAAADECMYAHDATYLPERGWWTDTARLERIRTQFDAAVKEEPLDLRKGPVEERILAEAFVPLPWKKDL